MRDKFVFRGHTNQFAIWLFWKNQFHGTNFESMVHTTQEALSHDSWSIWRTRTQSLQCAKKDIICMLEQKVTSLWNRGKIWFKYWFGVIFNSDNIMHNASDPLDLLTNMFRHWSSGSHFFGFTFIFWFLY